MNVLNIEECELLCDSKYKAYVNQVEKALKAFEYTSEWADLISALGKLNKVLSTNIRYPIIPKRVTIGKRLAQCLHPALPSGVHLKVLETYDIIFKCIGTSRLAADLFTYSAGLFPLLGYAAMNVRAPLLQLYETHFVSLARHIKPALTGLIAALLPGLEEGSEFFDRTTLLLEEFCESVTPTFFYGCLWECVLASSANRLAAINFVLAHHNKRQAMEDQLHLIGTNIDCLVQALCLSVQDTSILVQRSTLDLLLGCFRVHDSQLTLSDMTRVATAAINVVLRRDMSLNRRLYAWLLGTDANGLPLPALPGSGGVGGVRVDFGEMSNGSVVNGEEVADDDGESPHSLERQSSVSTNAELQMDYFNVYAKNLLVTAVKHSLQDVGGDEVDIWQPSRAQDGRSAINLRPFKVLMSLLDKPEIGSAILEDILLEIFRCMYRECGSASTNTSDTFPSKMASRGSQSHDGRLNHQRSDLKQPRSEVSNSEIVKTANLLFGAFEPSFIWQFIGKTFEHACVRSTKDKGTDGGNGKGKERILEEDETVGGSSRPSTRDANEDVSISELCLLVDFLLDKLTVEAYRETQTTHLPVLLRSMMTSMTSHIDLLTDSHISVTLRLCSKILLRIQPAITIAQNQFSGARNHHPMTAKNRSPPQRASPEKQINNDQTKINKSGSTLGDVSDMNGMAEKSLEKVDGSAFKGSVKSDQIASDELSGSDSDQFSEFIQFQKVEVDNPDNASSSNSPLHIDSNTQLSGGPGTAIQGTSVQSLLQECINSYLSLFVRIILNRIIPNSEETIVMPFVEFIFSGQPASVYSKKIESCAVEKERVRRVSRGGKGTTESKKCTGVDEIVAGELSKISKDTCAVFSLACRLLVELSSLPMYCSTNQRPLLTLTDCRPEHSNQVHVLPRWLQLLLTCACAISNFTLECSAISTILDLIGLTQSVLVAEAEIQQQRNQQDLNKQFEGRTISVHILPLLLPSDLIVLNTKTNFYKLVAVSLWDYLSDDHPECHDRAVDLFYQLQQLSPDPWTCEDVISSALLSDNKVIKFAAHHKFTVFWHLLRDRSISVPRSTPVRTFDRSLLVMLDSLHTDTHLCTALAQTWLLHSIQRGDLIRILEPVLLILLHPDTARVSIQHVNIHKPRRVCISETSSSDITDDSDDYMIDREMGGASRSVAGGRVEANIYAISSEGGHVIYHVGSSVERGSSGAGARQLSRKVTEQLQTLFVSDKGALSKSCQEATDIDIDLPFEKVNPADMNLHMNPFVSGIGGFSAPDGEGENEDDFEVSAPRNGRCDVTSQNSTGSQSTVEMIQNARRLTRETCMKEKIFFDDMGKTQAISDTCSSLLTTDVTTSSSSDVSHVASQNGEPVDSAMTDQIVENSVHQPKHINDNHILDAVLEDSSKSEEYGREDKSSVTVEPQNGDVSDHNVGAVAESNAKINGSAGNVNEKQIGIPLNGAINPCEVKMITQPVVDIDGHSDSTVSTGRGGGGESRSTSISCDVPPAITVHSSRRHAHTSAAPTVHPLHTHILLYTQKYDAKRTLYALQCIKSMLGTSSRLITCALTTANIGGSTSPHIADLLTLLVRHRRSVLGRNFHGELPSDAATGMRSSMFVEVLISMCLYYLRSYYPNLMMGKLNDADLTANKDIQILSCDILNLILTELISVTRISGRGFATYIGELMAKCKVQKALMYSVLASVYNSRQRLDLDADTADYDSSPVNLTEAIISFNDHSADSTDSSETLQIRLLKLLLTVVILEDQIRYSMGDHSSITTIPAEWDAFNINTQLSSASIQYWSGKPIVYQTMLLLSVVSVLRQQHMSHMHRHWVATVVSATPYLHLALTKITIATINQLSRNIELIAQLYEHGHRSAHKPPDKIPPDHVITLLEGMTSLCHHCLLDSAQRQQDLSAISQLLPDCYGSAALGASRYDGDGLADTGPMHGSTSYSSAKEPSPPRDASAADFAARLEAKTTLLNVMPRILASLTVLWKAIHVSEGKEQRGEPQPWWMLGNPKIIRQCILEFVSPLVLHHTQHVLAAVAVVWNERRQRGVGGYGVGISGKSVIPVASENQLLLVDLVSAVKLLPIDAIVQTVKQIIKQPPQSRLEGRGGAMDASRRGSNAGEIKRPAANNKSVPLEVGLLRFLYAYIQRVDGSVLMDTWPLLLSLLRDGLQLNLVPPGQFVLLAILNEFIQKVPMFEERKDQKDLQEITQKLLEACSEIAGSSLEQTTFFRRNLAVKPGLQRDINTEVDDVTAEEGETEAEVTDDTGSSRSVISHMVESSSVGNVRSQSQAAAVADNHQYSVQALVLLTDVTATLLDLIYRSEEKEQRVTPLLNTILYNVFPYLKNHSLENLPSFRACSQLLASLSSYQYTRRAWKKEVFDLLVDPLFFQMDEDCLRSWMIIVDNLMTHDRTTFKDLITRINVTQGASLNLFSSREAEFEQRAQLLKRLSFVIFSSEQDQYQKFMPDIQEKLAECLRLPMILSLQAQVFFCFRVLILRMSAQYLTSLWPTIITELVHVMLQIEQELAPDEVVLESRPPMSKTEPSFHGSTLSLQGTNGSTVVPAWLQLYLHACKLLDLALALPADTLPQFQLYRWAFVGDGGSPPPEIDRRRMHNRDQPPSFIPHVVKIARLMRTKFGEIPLLTRVHPQRPLLLSPHVGSFQDLCSFFATLHSSLEQHGGSLSLLNKTNQNAGAAIPVMNGHSGASSLISSLSSKPFISATNPLPRSISAPDVSHCDVTALGATSKGADLNSALSNSLSCVQVIEIIVLRDMLDYMLSGSK